MNKRILEMIGGRLAVAILSLFLVSLAVFFITELLPGDTAQELLGQAVTTEAASQLRETLGLDRPAILRYFEWIFGLLTGDLGYSHVSDRPVASLVAERLPNSLTLAAVTMAITIPLALSLGIFAAIWKGSIFDRAISSVAIVLVSFPEFMIATLLVMWLSVYLQWLPALSFIPTTADLHTVVLAYIMPVSVLVFGSCSQMIRLSRAAIADAMVTPYVEMAMLKGASRSRMVLGHALPNSVAPIVNSVALSMSGLLGGVIIVETVFNYPGLAKLMVDGVSTRDMPLIQTCSMIFCGFYLVLITAADIIAILSNPRLR